MARWEDALDAQIDVTRFWASDLGKRFAEGFLSGPQKLAANRNLSPKEREAYLSLDDEAYPDRLSEKLTVDERLRVLALLREREPIELYSGDMAARYGAMAFNSDPVWVDKDVWTLVKAAAESWPGERLMASDLPTEAGFMVLPEAVVTEDVWRNKIAIRGVNWYPMRFSFRDPETNAVVRRKDGILLAMYHSMNDRDDYSSKDGNIPATWVLSHATTWVFDEGDASGPQYEDWGFAMRLQVAWKLMGQEVFSREKLKPAGPFGKRAAKAKLEKLVTVVTLRKTRKERESDEPRPVDWTHRWAVSGHWRNWFFETEGVHRLIWVRPHVKGPEHLPLVPRKLRVIEFVR